MAIIMTNIMRSTRGVAFSSKVLKCSPLVSGDLDGKNRLLKANNISFVAFVGKVRPSLLNKGDNNPKRPKTWIFPRP